MIWGGALVGDPAWVAEGDRRPAERLPLPDGRLRLQRRHVVREQLGLSLLHPPGPGQHRRDGPAAGHRSLVERAAQEDVHAAGPLHDGRRHAAALRGRRGFLGPAAWAGCSSRRITPTKTRRSWPCWASGRASRASFWAGPHSRRRSRRLLESMVFEDAGHAILRTRGDAGLTAAMTFGPYGGFHGHFDKLSFVFFGFGQGTGRGSRPGPQPGLPPAHPQQLVQGHDLPQHRAGRQAKPKACGRQDCCGSSRGPTTPWRRRPATRPIPA